MQNLPTHRSARAMMHRKHSSVVSAQRPAVRRGVRLMGIASANVFDATPSAERGFLPRADPPKR